ncbi:MAG: polysaccharide deacetylase family protein [Myxococcota bacterium]
MTLAAVTVDLDGVRHYHAIHGLPAPSGPDPLLTRALPRFLEACAAHGIRATLFTVGQDLSDPDVARLIRQAAHDGHEIASHSFSHDYRLTHFTAQAMRADLVAAVEAIEKVTGTRPLGFRAPGYNLNESLLDAVASTGHRYDSSIFPSWPYFLARAAAIVAYGVRGSPSRSLVGDPRQFTGPRRPYVPAAQELARPARPGESARGLWELPIAVSGPLGLPLIGTFIPMYPALIRRVLTSWRTRVGGPFNLELHALDFAEASDGLAPELVSRQRDLATPLSTRISAIRSVMGALADQMEVLPLRAWLPALGTPLTRPGGRG